MGQKNLDNFTNTELHAMTAGIEVNPEEETMTVRIFTHLDILFPKVVSDLIALQEGDAKQELLLGNYKVPNRKLNLVIDQAGIQRRAVS